MCSRIQLIWIQIETFLYELSDRRINFGLDMVLTNKLVDNPQHVENFVCLLFKQYIYRQRCFRKSPDFQEFKRLVFQVKNIEKYIANKIGHNRKYQRKWQTV